MQFRNQIPFLHKYSWIYKIVKLFCRFKLSSLNRYMHNLPTAYRMAISAMKCVSSGMDSPLRRHPGSNPFLDKMPRQDGGAFIACRHIPAIDQDGSGNTGQFFPVFETFKVIAA